MVLDRLLSSLFPIGERSAAKMFMRGPVILTPSGDSTYAAPKSLVSFFVFPLVETVRSYRSRKYLQIVLALALMRFVTDVQRSAFTYKQQSHSATLKFTSAETLNYHPKCFKNKN